MNNHPVLINDFTLASVTQGQKLMPSITKIKIVSSFQHKLIIKKTKVVLISLNNGQ